MSTPPWPALMLGGFFVVAGVMHFVTPGFYLAMMPPWVPAPDAAVALSGAAEIAGGVGVMIPRWQRLAGVGLLVLLVAILPANVQMLANARAAGQPELLLWLRLPLQLVFLWWVWRVALARASVPTTGHAGSPVSSPDP